MVLRMALRAWFLADCWQGSVLLLAVGSGLLVAGAGLLLIVRRQARLAS